MRVLDYAPSTLVIAVTELPSQFRLQSMRFRSLHQVRVALGLHPLQVAIATSFEEGLLIRHLRQSKYVGEVGLDFSPHGRHTRDLQLRAFERLLSEPILRSKIVTVHSRGAEHVVIHRLREAAVPAILHWYTGPIGLVDVALASGLYFSINPAMLRATKGRALLAAVPPNRILTESDAPFVRLGRRAADPRDMSSVVAGIASHWDMSEVEARDTIYRNMLALHASTAGPGATLS